MEENEQTTETELQFDDHAFDFLHSSRHSLISRFLLGFCSFVSLFALLVFQTTFDSNPQINHFSNSSQFFDKTTDTCYNLFSIQHELNFDTSFVCDEDTHNFAHNFLLTKNSDGNFVASVKIKSDEFQTTVPRNEITFLCQLLKEQNLINTSFNVEEEGNTQSAIPFDQLNNLVCLEDKSVSSKRSIITVVQTNFEDGRTHTGVYENIRCKNELLQSCPIYYNFLDFFVYSTKWLPSSSSSIPSMNDITSIRLVITNSQRLEDSFTIFSSGTCLIVSPYSDTSVYVMDIDEMINLVYSSVLIFKDIEFLNGNGKDCENSKLFSLSLIWKNGDETATVETKGNECSPETLKTVINFIISLNKTAVWEKPSDKFSFTVIGLIFGAIVLFIVLIILAILFLCYRKENRDESIRDDLLAHSDDGEQYRLHNLSVNIPLNNIRDSGDLSDDNQQTVPSSTFSVPFSGWKIVFTEVDSDHENEPTVLRQRNASSAQERPEENSVETHN